VKTSYGVHTQIHVALGKIKPNMIKIILQLHGYEFSTDKTALLIGIWPIRSKAKKLLR